MLGIAPSCILVETQSARIWQNLQVATSKEDLQHLVRLSKLLKRVRDRRLTNLENSELRELPRLYRFASSLHARLETQGTDAGTLSETRDLIRRSHAVLYRGVESRPSSWLQRAYRLFMIDSPRALRAEWRLFLFMLGFFYSLVVIAYAAVTMRLELAFTLLDPGSVATEIAQLQATEEGQPFKGNFTFGLGESPKFAGWIMAHNMGVSVLFFASGLIAPLFFYVLASNALMVGTYTAVAAHWDQGTAISSILWCHGTLELQAIVISGLAGLILVRAWVAPGPWSRRHAMTLESRRSLQILAPVFPMLFVAGLIEGFISPHAPTAVRLAVAVVTGLIFLCWLLFAGRGEPASH
jgi:uncharacterized membrane protein SpoIIM required for sporulation